MSEDISWQGSQPSVSVDQTASMLHGVWRRKSLVLLGTLVGLVLATLYFNQQEAVYQSRAEVLVVRKTPGALAGNTGDASAILGDRGIPHERLVKSPLIAERTVKQGGLPAPETFGGTNDPVAAIIRSLTVSYNSNMLELSFRGPDPLACQQVLAAIIDSYRDFLEETYETANDDTLRLVTQKAGDIKDELRKKGDEYQEVACTRIVWPRSSRNGRSSDSSKSSYARG